MAHPTMTMKSLFRPFPLPLSKRQWFYIVVIQGIGAGFVDGGANFGIAYAMYHAQPVVKMWVFDKNTIAGDLGVTPIVQCLASMVITSTLVHSDLHSRAIQPLPFVYPHCEHLPDPRSLFDKSKKKKSATLEETKHEPEPQQTKGFAYYYWMLARFIFEGTEKNMMLARIPVSHWFGHLVWTAAQGAAIGVVFGFPLWCLAIAILGPIYQDGNVGNKWAPQVIKLVYGAIVGWVTNPVIAVLALGSQSQHHLLVVEHDEEAGGQETSGTTMQGGQELTVSSSSRSLDSRAALTPSRPMSSLNVTDTPSNTMRSRSGSVSSKQSRPPLTTNASQLSTLSPPTVPGRTRSTASATVVRPRGATVSSYNSNRSFSYALSPTGGRAQRPRSGSRATSYSGTPAAVLPEANERGQINRRDDDGTLAEIPSRSGDAEHSREAWDVFGKSDSVPRVGVPATRGGEKDA